MPRHAGFAVVAAVQESSLNATFTGAIQNGDIGPALVPLPTTFSIAGLTISFAGLIEVETLSVELHPNPTNSIIVHFGMKSTFEYQISPNAPETVVATLTGTGSAALKTSTVKSKITVALDFSTVQLAPLSVSVIQGSVDQNVLDAMQSQGFATVVANALQSFSPLNAPIPVADAVIDFEQHNISFPGGSSLFDWFSVKLTVSRVVVKPLEGALVAAVDFAGFTNGDENQLVDLTRTPGVGSTYRFVLPAFAYPEDSDFVVFPAAEPSPSAGAVVVNMNVLHDVVERQVSPQVTGTLIADKVSLNAVSLNYSTFDTDLQGKQDGIALNATLEILASDLLTVDAHIYIQPYLLTWDGTPPGRYQDAWLFYIARVEVDLPGWIDLAAVALAATFGVFVPVLGVIVAFAELVGLGDIVPTLLSQVTAKARNKLQSVANSISLSALPGGSSVQYIAFTSESVDLAINIGGSKPPEPKATLTTVPQNFYFGGARVDLWPVSDKNPINVQLRLRNDLAGLPGLFLEWEVRRGDTGEVILADTKSYTDSAGNGVFIAHHTPELYFVDNFVVSCNVRASVGAQANALILNSQLTVQMFDDLDRHHKFVHWSKVVHFKNAGTQNQLWSAFHASKLHRTAVSARCLELKRKITGTVTEPTATPPGNYVDELPFPWDELDAKRRGVLCDYCFFGGPDKHIPFPEDDSF